MLSFLCRVVRCMLGKHPSRFVKHCPDHVRELIDILAAIGHVLCNEELHRHFHSLAVGSAVYSGATLLKIIAVHRECEHRDRFNEALFRLLKNLFYTLWIYRIALLISRELEVVFGQNTPLDIIFLFLKYLHLNHLIVNVTLHLSAVFLKCNLYSFSVFHA